MALKYSTGETVCQNIIGTIFKYEVLEFSGTFMGLELYKVKNVVTGHVQVICENDITKEDGNER